MLKGKVGDKAVVVISQDKDKQSKDLVLSTFKDGNITQEKLSVDINGRVKLTDTTKGGKVREFPSVESFKQAVINKVCPLIQR